MQNTQALRAQFIDIYSSQLSQEVRGLQSDLQNTRDSFDQTQAKLAGEVRNATRLQEQLWSLESGRGAFSERLGKELDSLSAIPKITEIIIDSQRIRFFTTVLYCVNPTTRRTHEIGAFEIYLNFDKTDVPVRWFNKTRRVHGMNPEMNAPHVYKDGSACLGNTSTIFPELITKKEFALAAQLAIEFVESINITDSARRHLPNWPLVS